MQPQSQSNIQDENQNSIESSLTIGYQELAGALLERIWIIVLFLVVGIFCGLSYISNSPRIFSSRVVLYIEPPKNIVNIQEVSREDLRGAEVIQNMMYLIRSKPLFERVAKEARLGSDAAFLGVPPGEAKFNDADVQDRLGGMIVTVQRKGSTYIDLFFEHPDPAVAQRLANIVADQFIRLNIDNRMGTSEQAYGFLNQQLKEVKDQLQLSEAALQAYREKHKEGSFDQTELTDVNLELNKAKRKRLVLETDLKQIEKYGDDPEKLLGLESISSEQTVQTLQRSIAHQNELISSMTQRYTEKHPKLIKARNELAALRRSLLDAARNAVSAVGPRYQAVLSQERSMGQLAVSQSGDAIQYNVLTRQVETNRTLVDTIFKRISETNITKAMDFDNIRVAERALYPTAPIRPDKRKIMMAAIASGLLGGIVIAILLHSMDSSVKTVDQAEGIFRLPVLAAIPEARGGQRPVKKAGVLPIDEVSPAVRESFRTLLVSMSLLGRKEEGRICLFTSAVPAEGKTFCSFHCAAHLANQGARTLLVDADLRKPYLHQMVTKGVLGAGVTEVLSDQKSFDEVLQFTNIENLFFISAGSRSPNPPKLLVNDSFQRLIEAYREKFDYIIIDSAPVNAVADTLLMVQHVQRTCLITRAGSTPRKATTRAIDFLRQAGREPSGLILNRFRDRRGLYYYYHYSYHKSYGRESAYGSEGKK